MKVVAGCAVLLLFLSESLCAAQDPADDGGKLTGDARKAVETHARKCLEIRREYLAGMVEQDEKLVGILEKAFARARKDEGVSMDDLNAVQQALESARETRDEHITELEEVVASASLREAKDDQAKYWPVGTKFSGTRLAVGMRSMEGEVTASDELRLVLRTTERWKGKDGKNIVARGTWIFERTKLDARTGKVFLRFVDCKRPKGGTPIFNERGEVVLSKRALEGEYGYDWRSRDGTVNSHDEMHPLRLRVVR